MTAIKLWKIVKFVDYLNNAFKHWLNFPSTEENRSREGSQPVITGVKRFLAID